MPQHSQSRKVLITGASGFIGSFLVDEALKQGLTVYAGIRPQSSKAFLRDPAIRFFPTDLSTPQEMLSRLQRFHDEEGGFDFVIHNAGVTKARKREDFETVNHDCTMQFAEALLKAGKTPERFIFLSSLATYGPGDDSSFEPIQIGDPQRPVSAYGRSKLEAERSLQSLTSLNTIIVRPTAVYGPRDPDFLTYFKMIGRGIDLDVTVGRQALSFIYVKDVARAIVGLLVAQRCQPAYILSDGKAYERDDLAEVIAEALEKRTLRVRVPGAPMRAFVALWEGLNGAFGSMPFLHSEKLREMSASNWLCDSSAIWKDLQTRPQYSLEAGVRETSAWYREQGWL